MMDFNGDKEERMKWWNVVVVMPDDHLGYTFARGETKEDAKRWFDKAKYTPERTDYKEILIFSDHPCSTYNEFVKKEKELKQMLSGNCSVSVGF